MPPFDYASESLYSVSGQIVVVTGGANGIGAAIVRLLHSFSARIVFGDSNSSSANELLNSLSPVEPQHVTFVQMDVTNYEHNIILFKRAIELYGRVDHAICVAGVGTRKGWFSPDLSLDDVAKPPETNEIDVNLTAAAYFARVGMVYMHKTPKTNEPVGPSKSLTFVASSASFAPSPDVPIYAATKHGVLGLMRALAIRSRESYGVRVNAACPWMTDTPLIAPWRDVWVAEGLPLNGAAEVAEVVKALVCGSREEANGSSVSNDDEGKNQASRAEPNGRAILIEGGRAWDYQGGLDQLEDQLYPPGFRNELARGQRLVENMGKA